MNAGGTRCRLKRRPRRPPECCRLPNNGGEESGLLRVATARDDEEAARKTGKDREGNACRIERERAWGRAGSRFGGSERGVGAWNSGARGVASGLWWEGWVVTPSGVCDGREGAASEEENDGKNGGGGGRGRARYKWRKRVAAGRRREMVNGENEDRDVRGEEKGEMNKIERR